MKHGPHVKEHPIYTVILVAICIFYTWLLFTYA